MCAWTPLSTLNGVPVRHGWGPERVCATPGAHLTAPDPASWSHEARRGGALPIWSATPVPPEASRPLPSHLRSRGPPSMSRPGGRSPSASAQKRRSCQPPPRRGRSAGPASMLWPPDPTPRLGSAAGTQSLSRVLLLELTSALLQSAETYLARVSSFAPWPPSIVRPTASAEAVFFMPPPPSELGGPDGAGSAPSGRRRLRALRQLPDTL